MATGDTKLSICSDSLIMLGASPLSSFSEGTDAAQICDRLYDDMLVQLLCKFPWSFTLKKSQLARLADAPASEWTFAYALPADLIGSGARALFTARRQDRRRKRTAGRSTGTNFHRLHRGSYRLSVQAGRKRHASYFVQLIKYYCCWHFAEAVTDQILKRNTGNRSRSGR